FLRYEDPLEWPGGGPQMWVRDDDACGVFDQLFLGDGRGGFEAAGYGIGAPMQREQRFEQVRGVPDGNEMKELTYSYHLNHFSMGDFDADGRNDITQFCDNESTFLALADQGLQGPGYQI